jgi:hypothetical protein
MEELTPDVIKYMNEKELKELYEKIRFDNSPRARLYKQKIKMLKKLNDREYENKLKNRRGMNRFKN